MIAHGLRVVMLLACALALEVAHAAGGHETYQLKWPAQGEALNYHSCGCADACWVAELHDKRSKSTKASLRCDCERLHFSSVGRHPVPDTMFGSCSAINDSSQKFDLIPKKLQQLRAAASQSKARAARTIYLAESCLHLAGEFGGDQSERDKEINQEMAKLRCDEALDSLKMLQATLPRSSKQRDKVRELLKAYE
jgi:hypothetical protein